VPKKKVALEFIRENASALVSDQRAVIQSMLRYSWQTAYRYVWYVTRPGYRDTHTTLRGSLRQRIFRGRGKS